MTTSSKFTSADLLLMPDDGKRYEVIQGELHVAKQPSYQHQFACGRVFRFLDEWNDRSGSGSMAETRRRLKAMAIAQLCR